MSDKIFEIGFPKTGTTSLCDAMRLMGVRATCTLVMDGARPQGQRPLHARDMLDRWLEGRFDFDVVDDYEYIGGTFFPIFEQIDRQFPDSQFILTVRETASWLASIERFLAKDELSDRSGPLPLHIGMVIRLMAFGCLHTRNHDLLVEAYESHNRRVKEYFEGTDRLLVMDVCGGDGWEILSPFVDRPAPPRCFPCSELGGYF